MVSFKVVSACATLSALTLPLTAAVPLPHAKPGLWLVEQHAARRTFNSKVCDDDASQIAMLQAIAGVPSSICRQTNVTMEDGQVVIDSVCAVNSSLLVAKTVVTYDGDSAFTVATDGTFAPPFMGKSQTHASMGARWAGTCPFGMSPGDMIGPTGLATRYAPKAAKAPA